MTWQEQKEQKRAQERRKRERREQWNGLRTAALTNDPAAKLVFNRITKGNHGRTVTVGKTEYAVDDKGTYRRVAT